jgi:hypothetical protein
MTEHGSVGHRGEPLLRAAISVPVEQEP